METTLFYVLGIGLVLVALGVSALGLRSESFPSRAALGVGTALIAGLVVATAAFAVLNARDEQEHRETELAGEAEEAEQAVAQAETGTATPPPDEGAGEPTRLDLTSPEDGSLSFDPNGLEAPAGSVTLAYDNPSQVPHNVAIEAPDGVVLNESETAPNTLLEATAELQPGEYVFFCTVPGHREGGMEGTVLVE